MMTKPTVSGAIDASFPDDAADLTQILRDLGREDEASRQRLLVLIYEDLRRMAAAQMRGERVDHTLQATALIHEAFVRLFGSQQTKWQSRSHFFAAAAEVMRRILVDHARARAADKRGGSRGRVSLDAADAPFESDPADILDIEAALRAFEQVDPERAAVVKLRFFGGLDLAEIARALDVSERTVKRHWRYARAWLYQQIAGRQAPD
jgi:RNA polymerase sigma factor (TIGR02999 family)